jgi:hypothetical protein
MWEQSTSARGSGSRSRLKEKSHRGGGRGWWVEGVARSFIFEAALAKDLAGFLFVHIKSEADFEQIVVKIV